MSKADERTAAIDARIVELETRLAYQEDALAQLNDVVIEQRRQIDRLTATAQALSERLRALGEPGGDDDASQPPPHY